jgi:hypothetical protein
MHRMLRKGICAGEGKPIEARDARQLPGHDAKVHLVDDRARKI